MKKILFIDRDGTIIREPADEQIDSFQKLQFVPRAISNLVFLRQHTDYLFVMVSNQDGLGTDAFPEDTFWPVHNFILDTLKGEGVTFDDILIDPHFPEDNAPTRKPNPGLVEKYMNTAEYDIEHSFVIGDRDTDRQFAQNIGCGDSIVLLGDNRYPSLWEIARVRDSANHSLIHRSPEATNPRGDARGFDAIGIPSLVVTALTGLQHNHVPSDIWENIDRRMLTGASQVMVETVCGSPKDV